MSQDRRSTWYCPDEEVLSADEVRDNGCTVFDLTAHAIHALEAHKWLRSEDEGRDLGWSAINEWLEHHYKGWARSKLLEHLYGWRCWGDFGEHHYGLFRRSTVEHNVPKQVLEKVAELLADGGENLDVITWALEEDRDLDDCRRVLR